MLTRISPALAVANCVTDPFGVVGRPDADALARFQTQRQQPGGEGVHLLAQFPVAPVDLLLAGDQARPATPARDRAIEMHADGLAEQRDGGDADRPTQARPGGYGGVDVLDGGEAGDHRADRLPP